MEHQSLKYMGSKRAMLGNGLGEVLGGMVGRHKRFVDLFAGSASVAWHVAGRYPIETWAFDLQRYSAVLAAAVVQRNSPADPVKLWNDWSRRAAPRFSAFDAPTSRDISEAFVMKARSWSNQFDKTSLVNAYAGHYYSPVQAAWIQALRDTVPTKSPNREICLAALVTAASKCAAAPGHTAQPFQPTDTALKYLQISWQRNLCADIQAALAQVAPLHAQVVGEAHVGDANKVASQLRHGDLVFIELPEVGKTLAAEQEALPWFDGMEDPFVSAEDSSAPREESLALSLTRKVMEMHGGSLDVSGADRSRPGLARDAGMKIGLHFPAERVIR